MVGSHWQLFWPRSVCSSVDPGVLASIYGSIIIIIIIIINEIRIAP